MRRRPLLDIRIMNALFPAADAEALRGGEPSVSAEHLILAALELPEGSARRAFERIGADPGGFRDAVAAQHDEALRGLGAARLDHAIADRLPETSKAARGPLRSSASAQRLFRKAVKLIRKEKSQLYGAYIVLAATDFEDGTVARAFRQMGIRRADLRMAAREVLDAINAS